MTSNNYDAWADIYDSVYSYVREDIPYYVEKALLANGKVIELGCGTGRVSIPIAESGVEIVGLDLSEAMLEVARRKTEKLKKPKDYLTFHTGDMRNFTLYKSYELFNLAIIPFRGFLSLLTVEDEISTLMNIRRHLVPGGKLIFNIFMPDLNMLLQEGDTAYHLRDVTDSESGNRYVLWQQSSYDNYLQIISIRVIIEQLDLYDEVIKRFYRNFQLRYIHYWEMHHLLGMCGYEIVNILGDFEGTPFDGTSSEMIWETRVLP